MKSWWKIGALALALFTPAAAHAQQAECITSATGIVSGCYGRGVTIVDQYGAPVNLGGGGGSAADQSGTNATDGQATSTTNQHTLAFGYAWNGTGWDRVYNDPATHALLERTVGPSMNAPGTSGTIARSIQGVLNGVAVTTADQNLAPTITTPGTAPTKAQGVQRADGSAIAGDGTDNTGVTQPSSGAGIRGWLSAIYSKLAGTLTVSGTTTANQGAPNTPANAWPTTDTNASATITAPGTAPTKAQGVQRADGSAVAGDGTDNTGSTQLNGGTGIRGWLSGIYTKVAGVLNVNLYVGGTAVTSAAPVPVAQNRFLPILDTNTALVASGTFTGTARDTGGGNVTPSPYTYFVVNCFADQAGTLFVESSIDGTTWYARNTTAGTAVTAGATVDLKVYATMRFNRTRYVNGTTAQTKFEISTGFSGY